MTPQAIDLHVNPSDETIRLGPLAVRFLIAGEQATGTVAVYGLEGVLTWTVDGKPIDVGLGSRALAQAFSAYARGRRSR